MKKIELTESQKESLLVRHKCPRCGMYRIQTYNPNMVDGLIEVEVECQNCGWLVVMVCGLNDFYQYDF